MNDCVTKELLEVIEPFVDGKVQCVRETNRNWRGEPYQSDVVTVDENNHIGFEVMEQEIIMYYFSEHHHFEDYSWTLEDGEQDYVERAKAFLKDLFTCTITHQKTRKGKILISEKYIFTHPDGTTSCPAGVWVHNLLIRLVPFLKKKTESRSWRFDPETGCFVDMAGRMTESCKKEVDNNEL